MERDRSLRQPRSVFQHHHFPQTSSLVYISGESCFISPTHRISWFPPEVLTAGMKFTAFERGCIDTSSGAKSSHTEAAQSVEQYTE
jgi:hypothetical protein